MSGFTGKTNAKETFDFELAESKGNSARKAAAELLKLSPTEQTASVIDTVTGILGRQNVEIPGLLEGIIIRATLVLSSSSPHPLQVKCSGFSNSDDSSVTIYAGKMLDLEPGTHLLVQGQPLELTLPSLDTLEPEWRRAAVLSDNHMSTTVWQAPGDPRVKTFQGAGLVKLADQWGIPYQVVPHSDKGTLVAFSIDDAETLRVKLSEASALINPRRLDGTFSLDIMEMTPPLEFEEQRTAQAMHGSAVFKAKLHLVLLR